MINEFYMKKVFDLAALGKGHVSPNPLVGAILVKDDQIIGEGFHKAYGEAHAEVNAINETIARGLSPEGATLFINLEPCSHAHEKKQTPPCAPLIIQSKIKKVVIANLDPNPHVNGAGVELLKKAGIEVEVGVLKEYGENFNEIFFKYIQTKTPFIHLKMGQTLDGKIATIMGKSKYITSELSLRRVHEYRHAYDAILIGANTLETDNPHLTVRHPDLNSPSQPWRIVICRMERVNFTMNLFSDDLKQKTIVITTTKDYIKNAKKVKMLTEVGIDVIEIAENSSGEIDMAELLNELGNRKITSVLVEGGKTIYTNLLAAGLYDKVSLFIAPIILGKGHEGVGELGVHNLDEAIRFERFTYEYLGKDILFSGYPNRK